MKPLEDMSYMIPFLILKFKHRVEFASRLGAASNSEVHERTTEIQEKGTSKHLDLANEFADFQVSFFSLQGAVFSVLNQSKAHFRDRVEKCSNFPTYGMRDF